MVLSIIGIIGALILIFVLGPSLLDSMILLGLACIIGGVVLGVKSVIGFFSHLGGSLRGGKGGGSSSYSGSSYSGSSYDDSSSDKSTISTSKVKSAVSWCSAWGNGAYVKVDDVRVSDLGGNNFDVEVSLKVSNDSHMTDESYKDPSLAEYAINRCAEDVKRSLDNLGIGYRLNTSVHW